MNPVSFIFRSVFQLQTINKSLNDLIQAAEAGGQTIDQHVADKPDTPANREQMRHVIGIERWGQRRLKTMLGEPPIHDEYDGYQPAADLDLNALRAEFDSTRAETLRIVDAIKEKGIAETARANHNGMGDVSLKLWLRYLTMHANFESKRVK
ncbi:MAG: DinB family protein [Caldilineaceae bacterium]|nr:DinB family protein [Caldilineaceae bacterium]